MRFEFLKEHRGEIGPIKKACGLMKVSKSGFYEYLGRKKSDAQIEREAIEGFVVAARATLGRLRAMVTGFMWAPAMRRWATR